MCLNPPQLPVREKGRISYIPAVTVMPPSTTDNPSIEDLHNSEFVNGRWRLKEVVVEKRLLQLACRSKRKLPEIMDQKQQGSTSADFSRTQGTILHATDHEELNPPEGSKTAKRKAVPKAGFCPSEERRSCTCGSRCLLRVLAREDSTCKGRRLSPLVGLPVYTRESTARGGIIHDIVAGVRLVTEGAKAERVFALRARSRKWGVRVSYQEKVAEMLDTDILAYIGA